MAIRADSHFVPPPSRGSDLVDSCFVKLVCSGLQVETRSLDGYSAASEACTVPCNEKWVAETYFDKYRSLDDAAFEHYRDVELTRPSCEMLPPDPRNVFKLSDLDRHLTGEGSHRSLFTSIRISVDEEFAAKSLFSFCEAVLVERLPSGVFADPFELQRVRDRGGKFLLYTSD